jgi:hypothetical protein
VEDAGSTLGRMIFIFAEDALSVTREWGNPLRRSLITSRMAVPETGFVSSSAGAMILMEHGAGSGELVTRSEERDAWQGMASRMEIAMRSITRTTLDRVKN